jgi:hypothetical protein
VDGAWSSEGGARVGGEIHVRHVVATDEPGLTWRLEHDLLGVSWDGAELRGTAYRGRYLRHARDGHIVLPTSPPRKLRLPFDIGAEADAGLVAWRPADDALALGVVRAALVFELTRSPTFRRRLTVGPVARWDVDTRLDDADATLAAHRVAPFSLAAAALHLEDAAGLTILDVAVEAGWDWSSASGWATAWSARASAERIVLAVNDLPFSLFLDASASSDAGPLLLAGLRFAPLRTVLPNCLPPEKP